MLFEVGLATPGTNRHVGVVGSFRGIHFGNICRNTCEQCGDQRGQRRVFAEVLKERGSSAQSVRD